MMKNVRTPPRAVNTTALIRAQAPADSLTSAYASSVHKRQIIQKQF